LVGTPRRGVPKNIISYGPLDPTPSQGCRRGPADTLSPPSLPVPRAPIKRRCRREGKRHPCPTNASDSLSSSFCSECFSFCRPACFLALCPSAQESVRFEPLKIACSACYYPQQMAVTQEASKASRPAEQFFILRSGESLSKAGRAPHPSASAHTAADYCLQPAQALAHV